MRGRVGRGGQSNPDSSVRDTEEGDDEDDEELRLGVQASFPRMLAANAPDFSFARSRFDADPSELCEEFTAELNGKG